MYQNIATKVLTGEVRLSYAHLSQPYANPKQPGAEPKYSVTMLIPKTDTATKADIDASMLAAYSTTFHNNNMSIYALAMGYNVIKDSSSGYHNVIDRSALVYKRSNM